MIEVKPGSRDDVLEVKIAGTVTDEDYSNVLMPALDVAIEESDRVRLLIVLESGLSDYTLGAMWDDTRLGMKHWRGFDRVAVVTAPGGMARAIRAMAVFMPCPVSVFEPGQEDEARRWLTESLGTIHQTDLGNGVLHIQLRGKLEPTAFDGEAGDIDAFVRRNPRFRLLLDLREFDGWQGLGALAEHFRLVRDHVGMLDKAAIVGDGGWQKMAAATGRRIIGREAKYFDADQFDAAKAWISEA